MNAREPLTHSAPPRSRRRAARKLIALLALGIPWGMSLGCSFEGDYASYAVVYGISEYYYYDDHPWDDTAHDVDLSYCHLDAQDVADVLSARGYNVILRSDDPDEVYIDTDPLPPDLTVPPDCTVAHLEQDIASVAAAARPEDLFLFFFSGHGHYQTGSGQEPLLSDEEDETIILNEEAGRDPLSDDSLAALIRQIPCTRKIVIIDACFSGGLIGDSVESDRIAPDCDSPYSQPNGLLESVFYLYTNGLDPRSDISPYDALVIAAAGERESSYDGDPFVIPGIENGVFTHFFLEAADQGDLDGDGFLTVLEAYAYARSAIGERWTAVTPGRAFSPHVSGGPVDLILFAMP